MEGAFFPEDRLLNWHPYASDASVSMLAPCMDATLLRAAFTFRDLQWTDENEIDFSFVCSPFSWAAGVSYGPRPNVGVCSDFMRRPPEGSFMVDMVKWPAYFATRDIAARELLQLPRDENYERCFDKRRRIFARLAELSALGASDAVFDRELNGKLKVGESVVAYWEPLRDLLRPPAAGAAAGGAV